MKSTFIKCINGIPVVPEETKTGEVVSTFDGIVRFSDGRWCDTNRPALVGGQASESESKMYWEKKPEG